MNSNVGNRFSGHRWSSLHRVLAAALPGTSPQVAPDKAFCDTPHYSHVINVSPTSTLCAVIKV